MSRTDNTDPVLLQIWFSDRKTVVHDHRSGPCDAAVSLEDALARPEARCQWHFSSLPAYVCSCGHRHAAWWNWLDRKQSRRRAKDQLDGVRRLVNSGVDPYDVDTL